MGLLKNLFAFYINSSIHVALGVVALSLVTVFHFDFPIEWGLLGFIFFGTVTGYNFVKYAGIAKLHHRSLARNLRLIQIFSLGCFLALLYFALLVPVEVLEVAAILGLITALYALPVLSGRKNLREVAGLKVFVIALIWAGVTVLFPYVEAGAPLGMDVVLECCQRFLFVLILIIPFEIRDLKYDPQNLKTLPQRLGVKRVKLFGYLLTAFWVGFEFLKSISSFDSKMAVLMAAAFTGFALYRSNEDQPPYFASFWIEGIPILWMLLLLLFRSF